MRFIPLRSSDQPDTPTLIPFSNLHEILSTLDGRELKSKDPVEKTANGPILVMSADSTISALMLTLKLIGGNMAITRYEPWSLLNQLHRELDRAREGGNGEGSAATAEWAPAVDIKEEPDKFVIQADLPGVKPEEIDISMEDGVLTIKGEKKTEAKTEKEGYKRVERTYGSFYRRFSLPDTANPDAISAKSNHGVLEIVIPKREAVQPKKISVTATG